MRSSYNECLEYITRYGDGNIHLVSAMKEYLNVYVTHNDINDDFMTFCIKFRCFLLHNNIELSAINHRKVQAYIKELPFILLSKSIAELDLQDFCNVEDISDKNIEKIYNMKIPIIRHKHIYVIISAYDCAEYIEECLDSVQRQTYSAKRILLGIDGCEKTLAKVLQIRHKYQNLDLYYSEKNKGCYIMFNSLIQLVSDKDYILIFGADDVMNTDMIECMANNDEPCVSQHNGVLFIKKSVFDRIGGFRAWRCAADSDSISRLKLLQKKRVKRLPIHYYRREHPKQLTVASATGNGSKLRNKYCKITSDNENKEKPIIYIKPVITNIIKL